MSAKQPYKSIFGTNLTDRDELEPDELDLLDGLCEEADKSRMALLERRSVAVIARLARECGRLRKAQRKDYKDARGDERELLVHRNDCPQFHDFYMKYATGSKVEPSCFGCGQQKYHERGVTHLELHDIYLCKTCQSAISESQARAALAATEGEKRE